MIYLGWPRASRLRYDFFITLIGVAGGFSAPTAEVAAQTSGYRANGTGIAARVTTIAITAKPAKRCKRIARAVDPGSGNAGGLAWEDARLRIEPGLDRGTFQKASQTPPC